MYDKDKINYKTKIGNFLKSYSKTKMTFYLKCFKKSTMTDQIRKTLYVKTR